MNPYPHMNSHHVALISEMLLSRASVNVLEYGAGGSTMYWPRLLLSRGRDFTWTAVEHLQVCADAVAANLADVPAVKDHVDLRYVDCGFQDPDQGAGRDHCMEEYVGVINTLSTLPDIVIVDGRKRARCVMACRKRLEGTGAVIMLHDAQREYYASAFDGIDPDLIDKHPSYLGDLWVVTV